MLLTVISIFIRLLFALVGKAGPIVIDAIDAAKEAQYEDGNQARAFVVDRVKKQLPDIGEWLLNWLIENALGLEAIKLGKLKKKLKWPKKLRF